MQEIADELNVKRFEVVASLEGLLVVPGRPELPARSARALGKLIAAREGAARARRRRRGAARVRRARVASTLDVDGDDGELEPDDVEIRAEQHEELALAQDGPHAVALDLTLDDDLRAEGTARELSRAINDLRKANGFEITDRITRRATTRPATLRRRRRAPPRLDHGRGARDRASTVERRAARARAADATIDGEPVWLDAAPALSAPTPCG